MRTTEAEAVHNSISDVFAAGAPCSTLSGVGVKDPEIEYSSGDLFSFVFPRETFNTTYWPWPDKSVSTFSFLMLHSVAAHQSALLTDDMLHSLFLRTGGILSVHYQLAFSLSFSVNTGNTYRARSSPFLLLLWVQDRSVRVGDFLYLITGTCGALRSLCASERPGDKT